MTNRPLTPAVQRALNQVSHRLALDQYSRIRFALEAELQEARAAGAGTDDLLALLADRARVQAPAREPDA